MNQHLALFVWLDHPGKHLSQILWSDALMQLSVMILG